MSYDPKCHELAEYFLQDAHKLNTPGNVRELAQCIQDTIEAELEWLAEELKQKEAAQDDYRFDSRS